MSWKAALIVLGLIFLGVYALVEIITTIDRRRPNRYVNRDIVAERHRKISRNGFKSKQGLR